MTAFRPEFCRAIQDYLFFLERRYPVKEVLKLICGRYQLTANERSMLFRGISLPEVCRIREQKYSLEPSPGATFYADFFNQILIVLSYLAGQLVFISCDGWLRDASGFHGKRIPENLFLRSLRLVYGSLSMLEPEEVVCFADTQISRVETWTAMAGDVARELGLHCRLEITDLADKKLIQSENGVLCTADSAIIERSVLQVFDLARYTLDRNFNAVYTDLRLVCGQWQQE